MEAAGRVVALNDPIGPRTLPSCSGGSSSAVWCSCGARSRWRGSSLGGLGSDGLLRCIANPPPARQLQALSGRAASPRATLPSDAR